MGQIYRIEVMNRGAHDPEGARVKEHIRRNLSITVDSLRVISIYTILGEQPIDDRTMNRAAHELFSDCILQQASVNIPLASDFDYIIEIGKKPGVTDNEGSTATRALKDFLSFNHPNSLKVFFSRQYLLRGDLERETVERIAREVLGNSLIENYSLLHFSELNDPGGAPLLPIPLVEGMRNGIVDEITLPEAPDELLKLSSDRCLSLNLAEMEAIRGYFSKADTVSRRKKMGLGRITDVELEILAQTWSEHCKHKEFNAHITCVSEEGHEFVIDRLFATFIRKATDEIVNALQKSGKSWVVKVFDDNAGIVRLSNEDLFVFKVETHNAPSALDPYGGALTGIVGVNRDPAGIGRSGADLLFNTDVFCFGNPFYKGKLPPKVLHPMRVFEGVRLGVEHGGNQSGIPTINGTVVFDDRYTMRPLVFCGTGATVREKIGGADSTVKEIRAGDVIVMAGGRVGKDGIHGATFSSMQIDQASPVSAVQIGDPITQRKMLDFLAEARERSLISAITDNGAGGLSSSIGELARISGGARVDLERAPLKYEGLHPWEIFLSESQERMTLAVKPDKLPELRELAGRRDVEIAAVGRFTDEGRLDVYYEGRVVASLDMEFLHDGLPRKFMRAAEKKARHPEPNIPEPSDLSAELMSILSRLNVCSKEYIIRQYDHEVKGLTVGKPLCGIDNAGPADAAVIKYNLGSREGLIVANGICPRYSDIDPYWMSADAFDEAVRNIIAAGGRLPDLQSRGDEMWCMNDNFCTSDCQESPENPGGSHRLYALVEACRALYDFSTAYLVPIISGKDSMKNNYYDRSESELKTIPLTVLYSMVAKLEDVSMAITPDVKCPGDLIYICGTTRDESGGSEYYLSKGHRGNKVPIVLIDETLPLYRAIGKATCEGLVASCHDCSDGGLGVALAESAFSGGYGISIDLTCVPALGVDRNDTLLFSESAGRFVITVAPEKRERFEEIMEGLPVRQAGIVRSDPLLVMTGITGNEVMRCPIEALEKAWKAPLDF